MRGRWRWCARAMLAAAGLASCHRADTDGPAGTNAAEVCRAAIRAQCQRFQDCGGPPVEQCMEEQGPCPDYYFSADSNHTVASLSACVDALAARTCTDISLGLFPSCFVDGKRPEGAPCAYGSQCHSGGCGGGTLCGVCHPGGAALGAPCDNGCQPGTYCAAGVCVDGALVVHADEGQPCDLGKVPAVACTGDLLCVPTQSGGTAGTCAPAPGAGEPCAYFSVCRAGTVCTSLTGGGTCVDATTCGTGVACPPDSFCKADDAGITCAPRATVGQPCAFPPTPTRPLQPCVAPAVCNPLGRCVLEREVGEPCDDDNECNSRLSCVNGTCPAPSSCPVDGGAG